MDKIEIFNKYFEKALQKQNKPIGGKKQDVIDMIKKNKGSIQNLDVFPDWIKEVFVTAHDIPNKQRIDMQAAAQKNITMAVSSTVNLPNSATVEDVSEIYKYAWNCDLKGITVYRDGSLDDQPVDFSSGSKSQEAHTEAETHDPSTQEASVTSASDSDKQPFGKDYTRPCERAAKTCEANTPDGKLYVTGGFDNGYLMETFISIGKQGRRENTFLNGLGRVISKALQRGVALEEITDTLRGTGGDSFFFKLNDDDEKSVQVNGILDALALILDEKFSGIHFQGIVSSLNEDEEIDLDKIESSTIDTGKDWTDIPSAEKIVSQIKEFQEKIKNDEGYVPESHNPYDRCPECHRFSLRRDAGCRGGICAVCGYSNCG